jgi:hypothetical protein
MIDHPFKNIINKYFYDEKWIIAYDERIEERKEHNIEFSFHKLLLTISKVRWRCQNPILLNYDEKGED